MIDNKDRSHPLGLMIVLVILTFAIPAIQWLAGRYVLFSSYRGLISSILIILCICLWHWKTRLLLLFPPSSSWRTFCYLGGLIALVLLMVDIHNAPVAKITGQARSPLEVMDVVVLAPIAEELVFRGMIWSLFARLSTKAHGDSLLILMGSSLLFGLEHLGYWAQSHWPLPVDAYLHALSMMAAGMCFGFFRQTSRSISVPAIVHILANGAILLIQ